MAPPDTLKYSTSGDHKPRSKAMRKLDEQQGPTGPARDQNDLRAQCDEAGSSHRPDIQLSGNELVERVGSGGSTGARRRRPSSDQHPRESTEFRLQFQDFGHENEEPVGQQYEGVQSARGSGHHSFSSSGVSSMGCSLGADIYPLSEVSAVRFPPATASNGNGSAVGSRLNLPSLTGDDQRPLTSPSPAGMPFVRPSSRSAGRRHSRPTSDGQSSVSSSDGLHASRPPSSGGSHDAASSSSSRPYSASRRPPSSSGRPPSANRPPSSNRKRSTSRSASSRSGRPSSGRSRLRSASSERTPSATSERTPSANSERVFSANSERVPSATSDRVPSATRRPPSASRKRPPSAGRRRPPSAGAGRAAAAGGGGGGTTRLERPPSAGRVRPNSRMKRPPSASRSGRHASSAAAAEPSEVSDPAFAKCHTVLRNSFASVAMEREVPAARLPRDIFREGVVRGLTALEMDVDDNVVDAIVASCDVHQDGLLSVADASQSLALFLCSRAAATAGDVDQVAPTNSAA